MQAMQGIRFKVNHPNKHHIFIEFAKIENKLKIFTGFQVYTFSFKFGVFKLIQFCTMQYFKPNRSR